MRFATEWTTLAYQQLRAGNTAMFAFVLAAGSVPGSRPRVAGADTELAVIMIVTMCAWSPPSRASSCAARPTTSHPGGFVVVLIGLAAKNAHHDRSEFAPPGSRREAERAGNGTRGSRRRGGGCGCGQF